MLSHKTPFFSFSTEKLNYLRCLELAVRELLAGLLCRVFVLILPVVDNLGAAVEQQHLLALANPRLGLESSLELLPSVLSGPEEVLSDRATVTATEYLVNCNSDVLIQPQKVESEMSLLSCHILSGCKSSKAGSSGVRGRLQGLNLDLLSL